jgi:copper oxidase (laccase) domain-containing protein
MAKVKYKVTAGWQGQAVSIFSKTLRGDFILTEKTSNEVLAWLFAHNHPAVEIDQK